MDGPSAQGFLGLTGPLAPRVADCRSAAMLMKSALRDLPFCVIWHEKHYVDQPPPVAFPLWCLTAPPSPPLSGGTIKSRKAIPS